MFFSFKTGMMLVEFIAKASNNIQVKRVVSLTKKVFKRISVIASSCLSLSQQCASVSERTTCKYAIYCHLQLEHAKKSS